MPEDKSRGVLHLDARPTKALGLNDLDVMSTAASGRTVNGDGCDACSSRH